MDDVLRSYSRLAGQLEWLLNQHEVTEPAVVEAIRAALTGEPLGASFPQGSAANVVLRLACVWGLRAPFLDPRYLAMAPLELRAVSDGHITLDHALSLVRDLERRQLPRSNLCDRVRAFLGDDLPPIESLWSAEGETLLPLLRALRARMLTPEAEALLDDVSAELGSLAQGELAGAETRTTELGFSMPDPPGDRSLVEALAAAGIPVAEFAARLRSSIVGDQDAVESLLGSGLPEHLLADAAGALLASLTPGERFVVDSTRMCGNFDHGVATGVISAELLGEFLQHLFSAIVERAPIPELGPEHLRDPQQCLCDLFVDAVNADPEALAYVEAQCERISRGQGTTKELAAELARRIVSAKGIGAGD